MLYDYQQETYNQTKNAFRQGYRRPLVVAPCGYGKSYVFCKMAQEASKRGEVLILIHRQELKQQHERLFRTMRIPMKNIRIAMVKTEANRLGQHKKPVLIILDEAHLSRSNTYLQIVEYYDTYCIGFTATPVRLDGKPLGDIYDVLIESKSVKWLIENNRLAPYEYYAPTLVDVTNLKHRGGDYALDEAEALMMDRTIYGDVVEHYKRFADGKKAIAYCVSVKHSKKIAEIFNEAGIPAAHADGDTPKKQREQIMEDFRAGRIQVLCNCMLIVEGVSVDDCECCLLLRPTESLALHVQSMMRCMRYQPDKKAVIIDYVGNYMRNELPDNERNWTLDHPVVRRRDTDRGGNFPIRTCVGCYRTFKTAPNCPYCGETYPLHPREIAAKEELELKRITAAEQAEIERKKEELRREVGRARTYPELVRIAKERGYDHRWVYIQMKVKGLTK